AGFDSIKNEAAVLVAFDAAKPLERRVGAAAVARMRVTALRVGLPGLEQNAVDRLAAAIEHTPLDADALAGRIGRHHVVGDELLPFVLRLACFMWCQAGGSERADRLRRRNTGHDC